MRSLLLLALLASPAAAEQALVWLPPESYRRWSEVDALLREHSELKLTIGVSPSMATPLVKAALGPWLENGRVELAARIDGDPVLSAVAAHPAAGRPQDALELAADALAKLEKRLGRKPSGLLPGAGSLDAQTGPALGAAGADWIMIGPYAPADEAWAAAGPSVLVPSSAARLFDESASTDSVFASGYAAIERPSGGWATAGELARTKKDAPAAAVQWTAWDPAAAVAPESGGAKAAWDAYGAAAAVVERFQNSGTADLATLDAAAALLRRAQAARYFRPSESDDIPAELRAALVAVYKRLRLPAPESLYGGDPAPGAAESDAGDVPTGVKALSGPAWIEFRAPAGAIALAPAVDGATGTITDGGSAADPWRLRALRAEWNDATVTLTLKVGRAFAGPPRPVYEIYVDVNRVLGAGRVPLLEGRGAVMLARDAWELAVSIAGSQARFYRARGGGEPEETAVYEAKWASDRGEVQVAVPRAAMRGNPARWGWTAVSLAEDPARAGRRPAASLVGADGTILLGALVPADSQKAILSRRNPRLPAARRDP